MTRELLAALMSSVYPPKPAPEDDLDVFLSAVDAELTKQFGPDHQRVLSNSGKPLSAFEW